jgi:hypothetical protein
MTVYDKGDTALLTVTFRDAAGALTDPTVVKFRAVDPAGAITNWTYPAAQVTRTSIGVYVAALPLPSSGLWSYYWTTEAGAVEDATIAVTELATERTADQQLARRLLSRMVSSETEPTLDASDVDDLLTLARIPDSTGLHATDAGWVATYDLNFAAAEGWRWKAGKAAASYAFTMDGDSPERSFLMIRCEKMAAAYARKVVTSVPIVSDRRAYPGYIPLI